MASFTWVELCCRICLHTLRKANSITGRVNTCSCFGTRANICRSLLHSSMAFHKSLLWKISSWLRRRRSVGCVCIVATKDTPCGLCCVTEKRPVNASTKHRLGKVLHLQGERLHGTYCFILIYTHSHKWYEYIPHTCIPYIVWKQAIHGQFRATDSTFTTTTTPHFGLESLDKHTHVTRSH